MVKVTLICFSLLLLISCSSAEIKDEKSTKVAYQNYNKILDKHTVDDEQYSGFSNIFQYKASFLTEELLAGQVEIQRIAYQWDSNEYRKANIAMNESITNKSIIFLSFFTPNNKYNDLDQPASIWRAYLEVNGQRYSAKVRKISKKYPRIKSLYPYHSPWSKAYSLEFPIGANNLSVESVKLIITGNLAYSEKWIKIK